MQKWYRIFLLLKDAVRMEALSTTMIQRDRRAVTRGCYVNGRGSGRLSTVMRTCFTRQFMVRGNIRGTKPRLFFLNTNYECLANWGKSKGVFFIHLYHIVSVKGATPTLHGKKFISLAVERVDICCFMKC